MPSVRSFVAERIAPMLERSAVAEVFRPDIDARLFYWSIFALASAPFTQSWAMAQSTGIDFASADGISQWRDHATNFALNVVLLPALPR